MKKRLKVCTIHGEHLGKYCAKCIEEDTQLELDAEREMFGDDAEYLHGMDIGNK